MPKRRIDALLAERGLAGSRTSAAESVRAGRVRVGQDGPIATKPSQLIAADADLVVIEPPRYVSRGGLKLEHALDELAIDVAGLDCLDVGASTGGFTDCLLKRGAARVIALDVAHGQLDWRLRNDERVVVHRARQRARPRPRQAAVLAAPGDGGRLVHLLGQGVARRGALSRRRRRAAGDGQAAVRARSRAGGQGRRRSRRPGPPRRPARRGASGARRPAWRCAGSRRPGSRARRATARPSSTRRGWARASATSTRRSGRWSREHGRGAHPHPARADRRRPARAASAAAQRAGWRGGRRAEELRQAQRRRGRDRRAGRATRPGPVLGARRRRHDPQGDARVRGTGGARCSRSTTATVGFLAASEADELESRSRARVCGDYEIMDMPGLEASVDADPPWR